MATTSTNDGSDREAILRDTETSLASRKSLAALVIGGTVVIAVLGAVLFLWLAWLQSHEPFSCTAWMNQVDGPAWFNAARTTATILVVVGLGGAAMVAYRRQDTAELTHRFNVSAHATAIEAQKTAVESQKTAAAQAVTAEGRADTAAKQLDLDSKKYDLEIKRHDHDRERELRSRFTTIAEQLSGEPAVRLAGAYALAALADDWHRFGRNDEREVCVGLLCAQLRVPRTADGPDDSEFRKTVVSIISQHRGARMTSGSANDEIK